MKMYRLLTVLVASGVMAVVHAEIPATMTYQGRVQVAGTNFTGNGQFKFALVDAGINAARQATASAVVNSGFLTGVTVTDGGAGYLSPPEVHITDATGSGAVAVAVLLDNSVATITVQNAGSGYSANPVVTIDPPPAQLAYQTFWSNDGSSTEGSEPVNFVSVAVEEGLFTVILGDSSIPNMTPLTADIFANSGLHLRIWFNDGEQGFEQLTPDQPLTSVAFAMRAQVAEDVAAENIVRGVRSDDKSILVGEKSGIVDVSIARDSISTDALQKGSVTADKLAPGAIPASLPPIGRADGDLNGEYPDPVIRNNAVSGDKIASQGVELSKLSRTGAEEGDVLKFNGTSVEWLSDAFRLPVSPSPTVTGDQIQILDEIENATGSLIRLAVEHTNSQRTVFTATSDAVGRTVLSASSRGGGVVASFSKTRNGTNSIGNVSIGPVLSVSSSGQSTASAAQFYAGNADNIRPAVDIEHEGPGAGLQVDAVGNNIALFRRKTLNAGGGSTTSTVVRFDRDGKGFFDGGTQTGGADIAEAFEVEGGPDGNEPGDVMVISTSRERQMARSAEAYSTLVAGVIATKPGVLLTELRNEEDLSSHVPVGVVGVIPTKVSGENGPIKIGDLLVTSSIPGHAMKGDVEAIRERPGCILGKALESFNGEEDSGLIRVLVNVR